MRTLALSTTAHRTGGRMKLPLITLAALAALAGTAQAQILNIDARQYGFAFPTDPAPWSGS
jgi:hypothetical protein